MLQKYRFELLLIGLVQHLFIGIVLYDYLLYERVVWPMNMLIVSLFSRGVFMGKSRLHTALKNTFYVLIVSMPIAMPFFFDYVFFMALTSIVYLLFFIWLFIEVLRYLMKPSRVTIDIIVASICGYMILLEISVFVFMFLLFQNAQVLPRIDFAGSATIFMDVVYFSTMLLTTVGFGDITPFTPQGKLLASLIAIVGHFYSVVLVGMLISKFTAGREA